ncbi:MAG: DUF177 domain-containing protein [Deltaproteobacteria bacterium]|jgi:uncharacterized protein|nr:DUF177 domain-containing protein [Deltaproteobacteria bacterium]
MDPVRDNLVFSVEAWPEAEVSVDFILSPPVLVQAMKSRPGGDEPESEAVADALVFKSSMRGRLVIQLSYRRLTIKGSFGIKVELTCSRCLRQFVGKISDPIDEQIQLIEPTQEISNAVWDGDIVLVNNHFDLAPLMAELFWLSWPNRPLCKIDCVGLCPSCGSNLNDGPCSCGQGQATRH